jgi:hypothetical protein
LWYGERRKFGASRSEKSSLARAGFIPYLQHSATVRSNKWPIVIFRPGQDPVESLAIALSAESRRGKFIPSKQVISESSDAPCSLHWTVSKTLHETAETCRIFILIDQFEENFTPLLG